MKKKLINIPALVARAGLTINWLRARVVIDGDCWVWTGCMNGSTKAVPVARIAGRSVTVRRVAAHLGGHDEKARRFTVTCGNPRCVKPEHVIDESLVRVKKERSERRVSEHERKARIAATKRKKATLTEELVAEIRASEEPGYRIAKRMGVTPKVIYDARAYRTWKDYSSPWAGLMGMR